MDFNKLIKLMQDDPEKVKKALEGLSDEELRVLKNAGRVANAARSFSVESFIDFYWCLYNREPPPEAVKTWIPKLIEAYKEKKGVLLECHRGATKSTTLLGWVLFVQGHNPIGSTVFVRINDDAAAETGKAMASIIENHPGWKGVFPHIVPDKDSGWSGDGYFLKDDREDYGKWKQKTITDHLGEPSILVAGITSGIIIGKHPSNGMYFDDFHNERNTRSEREMRNIVGIIQSDIIPTWNRPEGHPTLGVACTLWSENDGYHAMLGTGLFEHVKTPIYVLDDDSDMEFNGQKIRLTWPEAYTLEKVEAIYNENPIQFARMYLCDLSAMKGIALKAEWLHEFPMEKVDPSWPVYFGIDFASTEDKLFDRERDYFALGIGRGIPGGGIVIVDGFRGKISTGEALQKVQAFAAMYPTLTTVGVEKFGKGEEFKNLLLYETNLPILPLPTKGTPVKSKGKDFRKNLRRYL